MNISHDHIYLTNIDTDKDCQKIKKEDRRIIRKKSDIQTDEDRKEYIRRRTLNNISCRISRIHRQSKLISKLQKCSEYEDLNRKLTNQQIILSQVIDQLKEHLRSLIPQ